MVEDRRPNCTTGTLTIIEPLADTELELVTEVPVEDVSIELERFPVALSLLEGYEERLDAHARLWRWHIAHGPGGTMSVEPIFQREWNLGWRR